QRPTAAAGPARPARQAGASRSYPRVAHAWRRSSRLTRPRRVEAAAPLTDHFHLLAPAATATTIAGADAVVVGPGLTIGQKHVVAGAVMDLQPDDLLLLEDVAIGTRHRRPGDRVVAGGCSGHRQIRRRRYHPARCDSRPAAAGRVAGPHAVAVLGRRLAAECLAGGAATVHLGPAAAIHALLQAVAGGAGHSVPADRVAWREVADRIEGRDRRRHPAGGRARVAAARRVAGTQAVLVLPRPLAAEHLAGDAAVVDLDPAIAINALLQAIACGPGYSVPADREARTRTGGHAQRGDCRRRRLGLVDQLERGTPVTAATVAAGTDPVKIGASLTTRQQPARLGACVHTAPDEGTLFLQLVPSHSLQGHPGKRMVAIGADGARQVRCPLRDHPMGDDRGAVAAGQVAGTDPIAVLADEPAGEVNAGAAAVVHHGPGTAVEAFLQAVAGRGGRLAPLHREIRPRIARLIERRRIRRQQHRGRHLAGQRATALRIGASGDAVVVLAIAVGEAAGVAGLVVEADPGAVADALLDAIARHAGNFAPGDGTGASGIRPRHGDDGRR